MKKFTRLMILGLLMVSLAACSSKKEKTPPVMQQPSPQATVQQPSPQAAVQQPAPATVPAPTPAPTQTPAPAGSPIDSTSTAIVEPSYSIEDDPFFIMDVGEDQARANGGFYIKRGESFYAITNEITTYSTTASVAPYGMIIKSSAPAIVELYSGFDAPDGRHLGIFSYDDVPILTYESGDELVAFNPHEIPTLNLNKVEFAGYTIGVKTDGAIKVCDSATRVGYDISGAREMYVKDLSGNVIEDYRNLQHNAEYVVGFVTGTSANEYTLTANSKVYTFVSGDKGFYGDYQLSGTPTANGYATYDLSSIEAGLYETNWGLIQIP